MTSRERFLRSMTGGTIDRFFRYEHGPWPSTRARWIGEGYPADANFATHFGMDPLVRIPVNSGYTDSPYQPKFTETVLEARDGYRIYVDTDGITRKEFERQSDTSMPQFLKFPVATRGDWAEIRRRLDPADAPARIGDVRALQARCAAADVPTMLPICGAFGHPRNLFGDEGLAYLIYDDAALLDEILDNWRDLYAELLRRLTEAVRVDAILIWEDMCYKSGPLIAPEHVARFMIPRYREVIAVARSRGVRAIIVDTDGDCLKLIPLFLDAGVDCMMPFEVQSGMDVMRIARQLPSLGIMGGIDKRVLTQGREAIEREVNRVLPRFLERRRFIPALDHTVPPNVSLGNFEHYLACVRRHESIGGL